jgi:protein-arginine kinase activator protein McsA
MKGANMTYLSRGIVCSACDKERATHTLKDEDGQVLAYLCDKCAEHETHNIVWELQHPEEVNNK